MADIREQLLAAFEVEYREHVDAIRAALEQVRAGQAVNMREAFRRAHSLKGAARAVDLPPIEEAAHAMEALFVDAMDAGEQVSPAARARLLHYLDDIERQAAALYKRNVVAAETDAAPAEPATEYLRVNAGRVQQLFASMHDLSANLDANTDCGHWQSGLAGCQSRRFAGYGSGQSHRVDQRARDRWCEGRLAERLGPVACRHNDG